MSKSTRSFQVTSPLVLLTAVVGMGSLATPLATAATSQQLISELKEELPAGIYRGRTHKRKDCEITVSTPPSGNFHVTIVFSETDRQMTFNLEPSSRPIGVNSRNLATNEWEDNVPSYVGSTKYNPRTKVELGLGRFLRSRETYYEGWEKVESLEIEEKKERSRNMWRVKVQTSHWGRQGGGGLTCIIEAPNG